MGCKSSKAAESTENQEPTNIVPPDTAGNTNENESTAPVAASPTGDVKKEESPANGRMSILGLNNLPLFKRAEATDDSGN